jgi:signal peptidase I
MFSSKRDSFLMGYSAKILVLVLAAAFVVRIFFFNTYSIQTSSMRPTLEPGDFILAARAFFLERGAVVTLPCPNSEGLNCIKRVVGLPGDRIEIAKQRLIVNDEHAVYAKAQDKNGQVDLIESLGGKSWQIEVAMETPSSAPAIVVPPGQVFLLNDNRSDISDSRQWGPIAATQLEAKAWRIWMSIDWLENRINWHRLLKPIH